MTAQSVNPARYAVASLAGLFCIGCTILALAAGGPWITRTLGYIVFVPGLVAAGLLTIVAAKLAAAAPQRLALLIIFGFALTMRLLLANQEPLLSTDLYRYVWDGRVQGAGINPYLYVPADQTLLALRDVAIYPHINRAEYALTAYPPIAEMFFFLVTRIGETLTVLRLAMACCEIVIVAVLIDLLRRLDLPITAVVAYAWHPLAVWEISNNGHVEALMVALMMLGVWLLVRARPVTGAAAVALSALVKPYAVFGLPPFWNRWDWRVPLVTILVVVLCYLPYLGAGKNVFGYVTTGYLSEEGFTSGETFWPVLLIQTLIGDIPGLTVLYALGSAIAMIVLGFYVGRRADTTPREAICGVVLMLTAGLALLSPNYPWYFLALVPFLPLGAGPAIWALTLGSLVLYRPWFLPYNELIWKTLAIAPFLLTLFFTPRRFPAGAGVLGTSAAGSAGFASVAAATSVVIPCLNEEESIAGVVRQVLAQGVGEVIVVDNGSTDATAARAREAGARVISESARGYGCACATGLRAVRPDTEFVCFLDGDGSDVPSYLAEVVAPLARHEADFVMGSRLRGTRERGSMTPQQLVAGRIAGALMRLIYGVQFTDMSPFRAMRAGDLRGLGMREQTYGWNLEMQMRVAAAGLRIREVPVDHRRRTGGVSKVSGNLFAGLSAAWKIATTFVRLAVTLRRAKT